MRARHYSPASRSQRTRRFWMVGQKLPVKPFDPKALTRESDSDARRMIDKAREHEWLIVDLRSNAGADFSETAYANCPTCADSVPPKPQYGESVSVVLNCVHCGEWFEASSATLQFGHLTFDYGSMRWRKLRGT
jgi:hypothetical protein